MKVRIARNAEVCKRLIRRVSYAVASAHEQAEVSSVAKLHQTGKMPASATEVCSIIQSLRVLRRTVLRVSWGLKTQTENMQEEKPAMLVTDETERLEDGSSSSLNFRLSPIRPQTEEAETSEACHAVFSRIL